jgi:hypothetical protein
VITRKATDAVRRLHRMREDGGLHLTGSRYPGHGRLRPAYDFTAASNAPPGDRRPTTPRRRLTRSHGDATPIRPGHLTLGGLTHIEPLTTKSAHLGALLHTF